MPTIATVLPVESFDPRGGLPVVYHYGTEVTLGEEATIRSRAVDAGVTIIDVLPGGGSANQGNQSKVTKAYLESRLAEMEAQVAESGEKSQVVHRPNLYDPAAVHNSTIVVPGAVVVAPPSDRWQTVTYEGMLALTGTGGAWLYMNLYDALASVLTAVDFATIRIEDATLSTLLGPKFRVTHRVAPHPDYKIFTAALFMGKDSAGSSRAVSVNQINADYGSKMRVVNE